MLLYFFLIMSSTVLFSVCVDFSFRFHSSFLAKIDYKLGVVVAVEINEINKISILITFSRKILLTSRFGLDWIGFLLWILPNNQQHTVVDARKCSDFCLLLYTRTNSFDDILIELFECQNAKNDCEITIPFTVNFGVQNKILES